MYGRKKEERLHGMDIGQGAEDEEDAERWRRIIIWEIEGKSIECPLISITNSNILLL